MRCGCVDWLVETVKSCSVQPESRDELLLCFMYYICIGNNASYFDCEDEDSQETQLEKALVVLRSLEALCTDNITQLVDTVATLIKRQVLVHAGCYWSLALV